MLDHFGAEGGKEIDSEGLSDIGTLVIFFKERRILNMFINQRNKTCRGGAQDPGNGPI